MVMKDYGRYLIFKSWGNRGVIKNPNNKYRSTYYNWMRKMVSRGWAIRLPDGGIQLRAYQHVWDTLRITKTHRKRSKAYGYQYHKIWESVVDPMDASNLTALVVRIRFHISDRKVKQLTHRLTRLSGVSPRNTIKFRKATEKVKLNEKPMLSCKRVAKMFGYKSATSVCRDYEIYFTKVSQERVLDIRFHHETQKYAYLFPCNRIHLNNPYV